MEKAAAEGCRANSHRGVHVLHSATEVEVEIFGVKANLQICRLDFWFISLISRNSIFSEGIDFGLVNSSILGEPWSLECHYLLQIMADFSGWSWTNNMVAWAHKPGHLRVKKGFKSGSLNSLDEPRCHRNQGYIVQTILILWHYFLQICKYLHLHIHMQIFSGSHETLNKVDIHKIREQTGARLSSVLRISFLTSSYH